MVKVDIEELFELKDQGKSYKEISEYYNKQGIQISTNTIYRRLKEYYKSQGKKSRKARDRVSTEELISLKEQGMSNAKISQYYKTKGVAIGQTTVGIIIREQYEKKGRKVPKGRKKYNIPIEELVELKEQGNSYTEISQYYETKGIQISANTIGRRLRVHYDLEGKKVPREIRKSKTKIDIPIEELVELKEQGKNNKAISEFYKEKGIQISKSTVGKRLKAYYKSQGKQVPRVRKKIRINIPVEELVELREQGLSYIKISQYYKTNGISISYGTVRTIIMEQYKKEGKKVPKVRGKYNIPIEELVELKEQGNSYAEISQYYETKGIQISINIIGRILRSHYDLQGKKVPREIRKTKTKIDIPIEELVELKEQGKSDKAISEFYKEKCIQISKSTVGKRLKAHYESQGKQVPRGSKKGKKRINISIEELIKLKEQGKSYKAISEFYKEKGIQVSTSVIAKRLKAHYESQGKKVPRQSKKDKPRINIPVQELVELRSKGFSYEEISEYYKLQGKKICSGTISSRIKDYYRIQGKELPQIRARKKIVDISIEELVELKEQGLSYERIAEYYKTRSIQISLIRVRKMLRAYYKSQGKKVPIGRKKHKHRINIPIEELVTLKEQGKTYEEILEIYKEKGITISSATVSRRLRDYYKSQGKQILIGNKKGQLRINISIEELVNLKEQGKSYEEISEICKEKGIQISRATVGNRLKAHYESQGRKVPIGSKTGRPRINIPIKELVELKEQGLSNEEISEYYETRDIKISAMTVWKRLKTHYESKGEKVPRSSCYDIDKVKAEELIRLKDKGKTLQEISGYYKRKGMKISSRAISNKIKEHKLAKAKEKREKLDAELKTIILNGESVRVYCQRIKCPEKEEQLKERIRRLKIIASKARKQGEYYIEDKEFLEVLNILENSMMLYPANKYSVYINPYITNGICRNGNIDLIQMRVFKRNKDLMCYILSAFKLRYAEEYDKKVWDKLKQEHEAKIDKYMGRLHTVEEKRSMTTQKKSKNAKLPQNDEDQR